MISLLLPSRGRPNNIERLARSVIALADNPNEVEIIVYIDDDDDSYEGWTYSDNVKIYRTERGLLSKYWNLAYEKATGPIYMEAADDIVFGTLGWDTKVLAAFDSYSDKIVCVYGDDGDPNTEKQFGTHCFLHKNWVDTVGYFMPPYFSSDFVDTWINEVADMIGRKIKIDILTEHMHPAFGKGALDLTHAERLVRHWKDDMPGVYNSMAFERAQDADKLKEYIEAHA